MARRLPALSNRLTLGDGLEVSPICLGMVSDHRTVGAAIEAGINFFFLTADMHWPLYAPLRKGLRQALEQRGARDRLVVCAAAYVTQPDFCEMPFEEVLSELPGLERLDVLAMGGVYATDFGPRLPVYQRHREHGFAGCRAIGASFHDRGIASTAVRSRLVDLALVRFNAGHPGARADVLSQLPKRRPLVFNFKSTDGYVTDERLDALGLEADVWRPSITDHYRYALSQPGFDGALVALSTPAEVEALGLALQRGVLDDSEQRWLEHLAQTDLSHP